MIVPASKDVWSASQYNKATSFVYSDSSVQPVFDLLAPKLGERILDMGCGSGELTYRLQNLVGKDGIVIGVDASESMLQRAKENGVDHCFPCDIQALRFPSQYEDLSGTFDAVFTNATLHWCKQDPQAVVRSVRSIIKPDGRFVGEFGGFMTTIGMRSALHHALKRRGLDPTRMDGFYHPRPEEYAKVLEAEGFKIDHISLNPRFTPLPGPFTDFLRTIIRGPILSSMDDDEAEAVMQEISDYCEPDMKDRNGAWAIMWMGLRFHASCST